MNKQKPNLYLVDTRAMPRPQHCPWCKSEKVKIIAGVFLPESECVHSKVFCTSCVLAGPLGSDDRQAITAWNRVSVMTNGDNDE